MTKNILVIQRTAPYGSSLAREGVDYILTSAAYNQNISLLFLGDGVFQLMANQHSKNIQLKNQLSALEVLPLYDIDKLFAVKEDLSERNLKPEDLGMDVTIIPRNSVHKLITQQDHVVGF